MQSKFYSGVEAVVNVCLGFIIGLLTNYFILPLFGYVITMTDSIGISVFYTVISLVRGYLVRRAFNSINES